MAGRQSLNSLALHTMSQRDMAVAKATIERQAPPVWMPGPTPEDIARQKADEDAWNAMDVEVREARSVCNKEVEMALSVFNRTLEKATEIKKQTIDDAIKVRQLKHDKAMQKFREKTLPA